METINFSVSLWLYLYGESYKNVFLKKFSIILFSVFQNCFPNLLLENQGFCYLSGS